jgi:DNA invertase Pin-like site-specific DNA recombinase
VVWVGRSNWGRPMKRAAIYVRVSTDKQTVENQLRELRQMPSVGAGRSLRSTRTLEFRALKAVKRGLGWTKC